jgi:hypothetical protein
MNARVAAFNGWPGERNTSWTMAGASSGARPAAPRCSFFFLQSAHSPPELPDPPQAHLRNNMPNDEGLDCTSIAGFAEI